MQEILDIDDVKHIVLHANSSSFCNASALYTYILTQHKKVTLFVEEPIEYRFSTLPWFEKIRGVSPSKAERSIEVSSDTLAYYTLFKENHITINKKMATSLYAGVVIEYENFQSSATNGMVYACVAQLISLGAEYRRCNSAILHSVPLARFRLKAKLFSSMLLQEDAKLLSLYLSDEDLQSSGASLTDMKYIVKETLSLVHVERVVVYKSDEENKIIYEEIRFE